MHMSEATTWTKEHPGEWVDLPTGARDRMLGCEWFDFHEARDHPETGVVQFRRRSEAEIARRRALH